MRYALRASTLAFVASTIGCRGEDVDFDCENQAMDLFRTADQEALPLRAPIPDAGPYPVALQLTEEGVNRLLYYVINDGEVPFFGSLGIITADVDFEPESEPVLLLEEVRGCPNCVVFAMDFGLQVINAGEPITAGPGKVRLSIPLLLEEDETAGVTRLIADYPHAEVLSLFFQLFGTTSEEHKAFEGALKILITERLQEQYEPLELLTIGSWEIGNGEVLMRAKKLIVDHELKKLVLAMQTNLAMPATAGLNLGEPLPDDIPMTISLHPDLFLTMSHRMLTEGEIPRRYDQDGNADPKGSYAVSLTRMVGNDTGADQLDTRFRVWRIAEGYCGWAEADMPLDLEVTSDLRGFEVIPGPATLAPSGDCEGSGCVAKEEEEIVNENQDIIETFRSSLAEQVGKTINFDSISLEQSTVLFSILNLTVSRDVIRSDIEFSVYKDP